MTKQEKQHQFITEKAFKQGKQIQFKAIKDTEWKDVPSDVKLIIWDWGNTDYRIKTK